MMFIPPEFRFDFIDKIDPKAIEKITEIRKKYIELDLEIKALYPGFDNIEFHSHYRTLNECRTYLEVSCLYAIKSLCLLGEIK